MMPRVSICLPCLNSRPFLTARLDSILGQTLGGWELIVVDGHSKDGSWELLRDQAAREARMRICQAPREGVYAAINACIRQARGEYVYIATADDTMTPDCLERMADGLTRRPECGVCHCRLTVIDEQGVPVEGLWEAFQPARFYGEWMSREHIRLAPLDGILHFGLYTVYTSLTQLLIRRAVFEQVGAFRCDFGSAADFEWGMRTSLAVNVLHVPSRLATWRLHAGQATRNTQSWTVKRDLHRMARLAAGALERRCPDLLALVRRSPLWTLYIEEAIRTLAAERRSMPRGLWMARLLGLAASHPGAAAAAYGKYREGRPAVDMPENLEIARRFVESTRLGSCLVPVEG